MTKLPSTAAFVALCSALTVAVDKTVVRPPGAGPSASWSHGLLVGDTLYVSGMGGENAAGNIPGDFEAEVKQAILGGLRANLTQSGCGTTLCR